MYGFNFGLTENVDWHDMIASFSDKQSASAQMRIALFHQIFLSLELAHYQTYFFGEHINLLCATCKFFNTIWFVL